MTIRSSCSRVGSNMGSPARAEGTAARRIRADTDRDIDLMRMRLLLALVRGPRTAAGREASQNFGRQVVEDGALAEPLLRHLQRLHLQAEGLVMEARVRAETAPPAVHEVPLVEAEAGGRVEREAVRDRDHRPVGGVRL